MVHVADEQATKAEKTVAVKKMTGKATAAEELDEAKAKAKLGSEEDKETMKKCGCYHCSWWKRGWSKWDVSQCRRNGFGEVEE